MAAHVIGVAGAGRDDEIRTLAEHDQHRSRINEIPAALGDQLKHAVRAGLPTDRHRHVASRLEPPHRPFEFAAAALTARVQPRVLDRDAGKVSEDQRRFLIGGGERVSATDFLGEVQVPPGASADHHRNAEEAAHRRMPLREAVTARVFADVVEPEWPGIADQHAEHAAAARTLADLGADPVVDAVNEKLLEPLAILAQHAECGVPRARHLTRRTEHALKNRRHVEVGHKGASDLEQAANRHIIGRGHRATEILPLLRGGARCALRRRALRGCGLASGARR